MLFNQTDLEAEIKILHDKIIERRQLLDDGIKADNSLPELKTLYIEIKELERHLDLCYEEVNMQRNFM